jgi:hypothetical protein
LQEPVDPSGRFANSLGDLSLGRLEIFSYESKRLGGIVKGLVPGLNFILGAAEQIGLRRRVARA